MAEEKVKKQKEDVEELVIDSILEQPITFTITPENGKARFYYIYPPSLGISFLAARLLKKLDFDKELLMFNESIEMIRICTAQKDVVRRLIAIHTFQRRSDATKEEKVQERIKELEVLDAAELSSVLLGVMTFSTYQEKFVKHYGIDKERKQREKVNSVKEDDSSSITFGGKSIYGSLLDHACERYGWELGYILWGISITTLNMMLADSVQSVYLTEKERKKVHLPANGRVIKADDPKNAAAVKAFFDSIR